MLQNFSHILKVYELTFQASQERKLCDRKFGHHSTDIANSRLQYDENRTASFPTLMNLKCMCKFKFPGPQVKDGSRPMNELKDELNPL